MESRIKIKMGQLEVECEGSEKFLEKELPKLLNTVLEFYKNAPEELKLKKADNTNGAQVGDKKDQNVGAQKGGLDLAINSVATKLNVKTGSDLILAAAARLTFGEGKEVLAASEIKEELKLATQFNSKNALKNFTPFLKTLVGEQKIHDKGGSKFAIAADTRQQLEAQLV